MTPQRSELESISLRSRSRAPKRWRGPAELPEEPLGLVQAYTGELAGVVEHLPQAVLRQAAAGEDDLAAAEVDRLLDLVGDQQQEAGAAAHVEQGEEIGDAEPFDAAVERDPLGAQQAGRAGVGAQEMDGLPPFGEDDERLGAQQPQVAQDGRGESSARRCGGG